MKGNGSVSKSLLRNENMQNVPAPLPPRSGRAIEEGSQSVGRHNGNGSTDIRSTVARRYMYMLRGHDRARMKVLSGYPTQGNFRV